MDTSSRIALQPTADLVASPLTAAPIPCAPWCWDHYDGDGVPADAYCTGAPRDIFGTRLFLANGHIPGQGRLQRIYVESVPGYDDEGDDVLSGSMSLVAARWTARALNALVDEALAARR